MKDEKTRELLRLLVLAFCVFAIIFLVLIIYYFPIRERLPNDVENYSKMLISYKEKANMTMINTSCLGECE